MKISIPIAWLNILKDSCVLSTGVFESFIELFLMRIYDRSLSNDKFGHENYLRGESNKGFVSTPPPSLNWSLKMHPIVALRRNERQAEAQVKTEPHYYG